MNRRDADSSIDHHTAAHTLERDDVLLYKLLRVRARLGLVQCSCGIALVSEIRLLDEVIEELSGVQRLADDV